jgi:glycosyltransferase involved in cell wall biosynthesis
MHHSDRPLVSIGISTYNRAMGYLREALQSSLDQTYPNLEIIVSDNCSEDETEVVVRGFDDPRIRYFRQPHNIGANNNFNFCLQQARGDYFLLLHDDDRIDPDFVEACMDAAGDATTFGLLRTGVRVIDATGRMLAERPNDVAGLSPAEFFLAWFDGRTSLYLCNTLYNTRFLREAGGFRSRRNLFQDVIATVRLASRHERVDVCAVKASFRRHGHNAGAAAAVTKWCDDSIQVVDVMCEELPEARDALRKEGRIYLARTNYRYASAIESPLDRARMYWHIYRRFGFVYSPLRYLYPKLVRRPALRLGRVVKSRLGLA